MRSKTFFFNGALTRLAPLWGLYTLTAFTGQLNDMRESMDYLYELGGVNHAHKDILL